MMFFMIFLSHFDLIGLEFDLIGFGATSSFAYFLFSYVLTGLIMLLRHDSLRFVAISMCVFCRRCYEDPWIKGPCHDFVLEPLACQTDNEHRMQAPGFLLKDGKVLNSSGSQPS